MASVRHQIHLASWIEQVTGTPIDSHCLFESLQDGTILYAIACAAGLVHGEQPPPSVTARLSPAELAKWNARVRTELFLRFDVITCASSLFRCNKFHFPPAFRSCSEILAPNRTSLCRTLGVDSTSCFTSSDLEGTIVESPEQFEQRKRVLSCLHSFESKLKAFRAGEGATSTDYGAEKTKETGQEDAAANAAHTSACEATTRVSKPVTWTEWTWESIGVFVGTMAAGVAIITAAAGKSATRE